jgi:hypothetical protein
MGMVTIPRAEYDRLVADSEMLADLAAYDAARAEAGEGMPLAVFYRIVSGEYPVKVIGSGAGWPRPSGPAGQSCIGCNCMTSRRGNRGARWIR